MRLKVTKLYRPDTPSYKVHSAIISEDSVIETRGITGGTRTHVIEGEGNMPTVGQSINLKCKPLNEGFEFRLFETSRIVRIKDDIYETESGSLYKVEELKDGN